jgi:hypothetical protein
LGSYLGKNLKKIGVEIYLSVKKPPRYKTYGVCSLGTAVCSAQDNLGDRRKLGAFE